VTNSNFISISGRRIGADHPPYVIAEMSGNHNGDIERAFAIIDAAKQSGADAVKLQTYTADTITIDHDGPGFRIEGGLWDGSSLYELYEKASTPWDWHGALFERGARQGITVFSSPFDNTAVDLLESLEAPAYKIASFELLDIPLIEKVSGTGKPVIMSTGMANLGEIEDAVNAAHGAGCAEIALLHCVSGYPTPVQDSNLRTLSELASRFDVVLGLSDHTLSTATAVAAVALGASVIEKHFTLSRSDGGPDAAFSLEPAELKQLCADVRISWEALGVGGFEQKPSEQDNAIFRRSLYAVDLIPKGDELTENNIRSIRPSYGLAPKHYQDVLGRRASVDIPRGTPLNWDLFE